ncbi:hypothetical protein SAMN05216490_1491 [Mucilaginibacter mallensis]|uniref:Uncharacterized protein n=1 Tax=Mucilaginibacter mallensis TaxID=652787 RepID=A0A1H1TPL7_MUCMA|nr:hypothetical protein [Mucilaginibacter mallensis]SDS62190.1 hypothetical protein SAMN05216490_1491 [Mucilaginibacter mallensis]
MSKHIDKLKKQLAEIAEVVNSFKSEAVQLKIVEKLLDVIIDTERSETEGVELFTKKGKQRSDDHDNDSVNGRKKPGATKVLNQLLSTDFFYTPRSIASIANYCKDNFDSEFKTSELSGILLKLANEHKLRRERSHDNNRYEYVSL